MQSLRPACVALAQLRSVMRQLPTIAPVVALTVHLQMMALPSLAQRPSLQQPPPTSEAGRAGAALQLLQLGTPTLPRRTTVRQTPLLAFAEFLVVLTVGALPMAMAPLPAALAVLSRLLPSRLAACKGVKRLPCERCEESVRRLHPQARCSQAALHLDWAPAAVSGAPVAAATQSHILRCAIVALVAEPATPGGV